jgi:hypothetical protein
VDPRAGVGDVEKILDPTGTRIPTSSVVQPVASRYTDYAIPRGVILLAFLEIFSPLSTLKLSGNLCSSLSVKGQASHSSACKIKLLYSLIFTHLHMICVEEWL